jgi:hypothetical protein
MRKKNRWQLLLGNRLNARLASENTKKLIWREDMSQLILSLLRTIVWRKLRPLLLNKGKDLIEDAESVSDNESVACLMSVQSPFQESRRLNTILVSWSEMAEGIVEEVSAISKGIRNRLIASGQLTDHDPWPPVPRLRSSFRYSPLDFDAVERGGRRVALYSLADLLGEDMATKLLQSTRYTDCSCLALKVSVQTRNAQVWMMRLQGYLAEEGS